MTIAAEWVAPRHIQRLTDLEFSLKNGKKIMIAWESGVFGMRRFEATGVSTTDEDGRVTTGNLHFLRENIDNLVRIHYLSESEDGGYVKSIVFTDRQPGRYKSESWCYNNPNFHR